MAGTFLAKVFDRDRMEARADWLAVAVAVSLPWSTSATGILSVIWLLAVIPTLTWPSLRRELTSAAGGLPVLLFLLGALGMLWAEVPWAARFGGLDGFAKLLLLPLLMVQFRRSDRGRWVLIGFLLACVALLIASVAVTFWPQLVSGRHNPGVPVKNYIMQSAEFAICAAVLVDIARARAAARQWLPAAGALLLALAFLADILFVVTSRTTLVILPALALVYGFRQFGWKGLVGAVAIGVVVAAVALDDVALSAPPGDEHLHPNRGL